MQLIIDIPNESRAQIGTYVVSARMNVKPADDRAKRSPYEIYYGQETADTVSYISDSDLWKRAKTEHGWNILINIEEMNKIKTMAP